MPEDNEEVYLFISHASKDKKTPAFNSVLERLHAAGIPMGIDRPWKLSELLDGVGAEDFVSILDGRNEDWQRGAIRALVNGACGIVVLASSNTGETSRVWDELVAAETIRYFNPNYQIFLLALEPTAHEKVRKEYQNKTFVDVAAELDGEIKRMREHLIRERTRRAARPRGAQLIDGAMKAMIRDHGTIPLLGSAQGPRISIDEIFTPLRADTLASAERSAAHRDLLDPEKERTDLETAGSRDDRMTRLSAMRTAHIRRNPIMPGMQQGQAAAFDPWAVAGASTPISDVVTRHGRMVILGEPAAGKTTLLRWLALRFAEVWAARDESGSAEIQVSALRRHVDPAARVGDTNANALERVSLGPARLPVFLSVVDLNKYITDHGDGSLEPYLAMELARKTDLIAFPDRNELARAMIEGALKAGRLMVLIDGLDEVAESERGSALKLIEAFAETWTSSLEASEPRLQNRIVVTSRIVGYHALPLSSDWPHVVVDRMTPAVVLEFWERLYRSSAFGRRIDAAEQAGALHASVYRSGRPGLAALAGVPLLASLLAVIYGQDGKLPDYRAQIYDRAFDVILHARGSSRLDADFVKRWLAPLAEEMHRSEGPALVDQRTLIRKLSDRLKAIEPGLRTDADRTDMAKRFLEENKLSLGLLVERSPELWTFVHRTFQEYLAGLWLAEGGHDAALLARRIVDPRWRESLLLLLGSSVIAGEEDNKPALRDKLFEDIVGAVEDSPTRAQVGRFLLDGLADMPDLPSDGVLRQTVRAALSEFADQGWDRLPGFIRARAIASLYGFGRRDPERLERVIAKILLEGPGEVSRAIARIVVHRHWRTPDLEQALRGAQAHDLMSEGFPILQALRQVTSELCHGELGAGGKDRARSMQIDKEREVTLEGLWLLADQASRARPKLIYDEIRLRADRGRYLYINRFQLSDEKVDGHLKRGAATGGVGCEEDTETTRRAARRVDLAAQRGIDDLTQIALHGAFEYRGRGAALADYRRLVHFVGMGLSARQAILEYDPELRMMFGTYDPIYYIAVNLDQFLEPTFNDALPPYLEMVEAGSSAPDASARQGGAGWGFRWPRSRPIASPEQRAQDVLAEALGDPAGAKPLDRLTFGLGPRERAMLDRLLRATLVAARDAVVHAGHHIAVHANKAAPEAEAAVIQALDTAAKAAAPSSPLRVSGEVTSSTPMLFAERIAYRMLGLEVHDGRYAAAVALDAQNEIPAATLLTVLQALPETAAMAWAGLSTGIHSGSSWPIDLATGEITLAALDMASGIDAGGDLSLRAAQASTLLDRMRRGSSLAAASCTPFAAVLPVSVLEWKTSIAEARETVARAGNAYHSARLAIGLFEMGASGMVLEEVEPLVRAIDNAVLRLDIAERLAKLAPEDRAAPLRQAAMKAARAIENPSQRWRGLWRLALQPGYPTQRLLDEAGAAIAAIDSCKERDLASAAAIRLLNVRPPGMPAEGETPRQVRLPQSVAKSGRLAPRLVGLPADFGDAEGILYVAQTCLDLLAELESADVGTAGGCDLSTPGAEALWDVGLPPPELTVALADAILAIAASETGARLSELRSVRWASRTRITAGFSIHACERWLARPEHPLAWIAALAIVKARPRRDKMVLDPLINAICSDDEIIAAEAVLMLTRGRYLIKRAAADSLFEDMGFDTLLWIGRSSVDPRRRNLRRIFSCLVMDIYVADEELIARLLDHLQTVPEDEDAIAFILEHLTWTTPPTTEAIMKGMQRAGPEIQAAMLISLACVDLTQRVEHKDKGAAGKVLTEIRSRPVTAERLAEAVRTLPPSNDTTPFRIFQQGSADLCALMAKACRTEPRPARRVAAFETALDAAHVDVRDRMSGAATAFESLDGFLGSATSAYGALPFRHDRFACDELRRQLGVDAVYLAVELLVRFSGGGRADGELAGLVCAMCLEYALATPSLTNAAFRQTLGSDGGVAKFLATLIEAPPRGISTATAAALACALRPLDVSCVEALVAVSTRPDLGDWVLLEQSLLGLGRLEAASLPVLKTALASERPRTNLLAIRLLGILARDAIAGSEIRAQARAALESLSGLPAARQIAIFVPANADQEDGCILRCGALADAIRTEMFLADGVQL